MWEALKRCDQALWSLREGERVYRTGDGINLRMPKGHGVEQRSHFPVWAWRAAAWMHNHVVPRVVLGTRALARAARVRVTDT